MAQELRVRLLGQFSLALADKELTGAHTARLQALLAYLLLHRDAPLARQPLAFLFWPDTSEAQAQTNLRQLLHRLRRRLLHSEAYLQVTEKTIRWRPDAPFTLDVSEFEAALANARRGHDGARLEALERAVAAYGGELLPSCYDDWLLPERARLARCFSDALEQLIRLLAQRRDYRRAIGYAERLLHYDPLDEAAYRHLMRLHALNGDRPAALRVYHRCVTTLKRELDVAPSRATLEAYQRLLDVQGAALPAPAPQADVRLVGRQVEWQLLQDAWRALQRSGVGCVCLTGDAGIGKTRLAEQVLHWAHSQGIASATARAYVGGRSLAYAPLVELLRGEALRARVGGLAPVWRSELARLLPELLAEDSGLPRPEPLAESWQVQRMYDAVSRVLLQPGQPLVLLLDDLQWFDAESLAWLHYLLRPAPPTGHATRLLVLATFRQDDVDEGHPLRRVLADVHPSDRVMELALDPLAPAESAELAALVAGRQLDAGAAAAIHRLTEGNPLFVIETVRAAEAAAAPGFVAAAPLTPKVQAVIAARLAQLSPAARALVGVAAVIGRSFDYDLLAPASEQDEDTVVRCLDELWQRRIIREQEGINAYDFTHGRLRDEAYAALSPARRRQLHLRLARTLESIYAQDTAPASTELARHYENAGQFEPAIHYLRSAAVSAFQVHAYDESIALLNHGLGLLHSLPASTRAAELELELQMALCTAWAAVTDYLGDEVAAVYRRSLALCRQIGNGSHLFTVLWGLHEVALYRAEYGQSLELAQQCLGMAETMGDPGLRLEAHHAAWGPYYFMGKYDEAFRHIERGLALYSRAAHERLSAEYGAHDAGDCALQISALALWNLGHIGQARQKLEAARAFAPALALPSNIADSYSYSGLLYHLLREPEQAQTSARIALQISTEKGYRFSGLLATMVLGWSLALLGQPAEGITLARQAMAASEKSHQLVHRSQFAAMLAEIHLRAGRYREAVAVVDAGIAEFARFRDLLCAPDLWTLKGDALRALHAPDVEVEACYQAGLDLGRQLSARVSQLRAAMGFARLRQSQGRAASGYQVLYEAYGWFKEGLDAADLQAAALLLSELAPAP